jgi:protease-4
MPQTAFPLYAAPTPPFRRRRPKTFWFLILVLLLLVLSALGGLWSEADERGLFSGPRLGLLKIEGVILDAEEFTRWAERLRRDKSVAGVLLRINSPGGAVAPSQEMHRAVKRLAASGRPVVVSMGAVAASGGYYVAVGAGEIYASPATLTGSIGVKLQTANLEELMRRIGLQAETLATGELKDAGTPFRAMNEAERAYLSGLIADMQQEFVEAVAEGRGLSREEVRGLADGRAFTGRQALRAKLVDRLGDQEDALERLAALAGLPGRPEKLLEAPEPKKPFWKTLLSALLDLDKSASLAAPRYGLYYF